MILQALHRLAEMEGLVDEPDFENKPVAWLIRIAAGGKLIKIDGTHYEPPMPEGTKKKPKSVTRVMRIPRQSGRSGKKAPAAFFVDNAKYVFGLPTKDKFFDEAEGIDKSGMFLDVVRTCADKTQDPGAIAVLEFLEQVHADRTQISLPENCLSNELFAFIYAPDVDILVHEREAVADYWRNLRATPLLTTRKADEQPICLVTGERTVPARLFPLIKKVPGGSTSGVGLVSFNSPAFESYGWRSNENAPISSEATMAASEALRRLVDPVYPNPEDPSVALPTRRISISDDTLVCYWASGKSDFINSFAGLQEADVSAVPQLYQSIWQGRAPAQPDNEAFYAVTITGTQGRAIVRDWFESTVSEVAENVAQHFQDLEIVRNAPVAKDKAQPAFPLNGLLSSLAVLGKRENIPKPLSSGFFRSAISGQPYPLAILQKALERTRSEITRADYLDKLRRDARAALIKAVLIRHPIYKMELTPMLDESNEEPGYLLGRLMSLLENLQQKALGYDVNSTIVDRYFGSASATPAVVFPRLLKGARYHASKAKGGDAKTKSAAIRIENDIDAVLAKMPANFPVWLNLKQQGLFVLGYHQQRGYRRPETSQSPDVPQEPTSEN